MAAAPMRVNAPQVIHEAIDGEVIIIDLGTGTYFSAKGSAADVWTALQGSAGAGADAVVAAVAGAYGLQVGDVHASVTSFLQELRDEGLVVDADGEGELVALEPRAGVAFAAPRLEKYTDMQDLVLIDPVHQVDSAGWPERAPEELSGQPSA